MQALAARATAVSLLVAAWETSPLRKARRRERGVDEE
jgi:hypothetical protein